MCSRCGGPDDMVGDVFPHECPDCGTPLKSYGLCCRCVKLDDGLDECPHCGAYSWNGELCKICLIQYNEDIKWG